MKSPASYVREVLVACFKVGALPALLFGAFYYVTQYTSVKSVVPTNETRPALPFSAIIAREEIVDSAFIGLMPDSGFEIRVYFAELNAGSTSVSELVAMHDLQPWIDDNDAIIKSMARAEVPEWFIAGVKGAVGKSGAKAYMPRQVGRPTRKGEPVRLLTADEKVFVQVGMKAPSS